MTPCGEELAKRNARTKSSDKQSPYQTRTPESKPPITPVKFDLSSKAPKKKAESGLSTMGDLINALPTPPSSSPLNIKKSASKLNQGSKDLSGNYL